MKWQKIENTKDSIEQIREVAKKRIVVLVGMGQSLGQFSGYTHDEHGGTWFINDALYDGDIEPDHWIGLPHAPASP